MQRVARGETPAVSDLYKRKSIKDEYFFTAEPPFYGKCAYCEAPIRDYQHGDVEHFRPKAGVTDENGQPVFLLDEDGKVQVDADGEPVEHPGYYWLAYEWTNLLPACVKCNQADVRQGSRTGKHSRFPVEGRHAQRPEEVAQEKPLLINPLSDQEDDDPSHHLVIDTKTGPDGSSHLARPSLPRHPRAQPARPIGRRSQESLSRGRVSVGSLILGPPRSFGNRGSPEGDRRHPPRRKAVHHGPGCSLAGTD